MACRNWQQTGSCYYGSKCKYAHSNSNTDKSKTCRDWTGTSGSCRHGNGCRFLHAGGGRATDPPAVKYGGTGTFGGFASATPQAASSPFLQTQNPFGAPVQGIQQNPFGSTSNAWNTPNPFAQAANPFAAGAANPFGQPAFSPANPFQQNTGPAFPPANPFQQAAANPFAQGQAPQAMRLTPSPCCGPLRFPQTLFTFESFVPLIPTESRYRDLATLTALINQSEGQECARESLPRL